MVTDTYQKQVDSLITNYFAFKVQIGSQIQGGLGAVHGQLYGNYKEFPSFIILCYTHTPTHHHEVHEDEVECPVASSGQLPHGVDGSDPVVGLLDEAGGELRVALQNAADDLAVQRRVILYEETQSYWN